MLFSHGIIFKRTMNIYRLNLVDPINDILSTQTSSSDTITLPASNNNNDDYNDYDDDNNNRKSDTGSSVL